MGKTSYTCILNLIIFLFISNESASSARILGDQSQYPHPRVTPHPIIFFMDDVLRDTRPSSIPATTNQQSPFPAEPVDLFPPTEGMSPPELPPTVTGPSTQTLDISSVRLPFPAMATLQGLEFGTVITINKELRGDEAKGSRLIGKAQGMYVGSWEDGSNHMVAMTVRFANGGFKDSLNLFGVDRSDVAADESHIAVIGGTGKYSGANGYATVKDVTPDSASDQYAAHEPPPAGKNLLKFTVYLISY
ncbi:PREDICTED: dirigent protein 25-like [Nelumbo nucifera]|uniref:Dirigent protein n=2 Tax=Nelumbo nucifera TaxID=4432 RepID=A0A1U8ACX6_NELNU|nr:PREDICTED: dirigent protein 25-like [Nelumbo nucifera]DAD27815.1 TPA_asm: hypothetical protein HUJ06_029283 [Nelumbo nucifera]